MDIYCSKYKNTRKIKLSFPYDKWLIKTIKGSVDSEDREYKKEDKTSFWLLKPFGFYVLTKQLKSDPSYRFIFEDPEDSLWAKKQIHNAIVKNNEKLQEKIDLENNKREWLTYKELIKDNPQQNIHLFNDKFKSFVNFYPYQIEAALFGTKIKKCLFSMEMGTGKSLTSIMYSTFIPYEGKIFVITPNSLKGNYVTEVTKFLKEELGYETYRYDADKPINKVGKNVKFIIVNYDFFSRTKSIESKFKKMGINPSDIDCIICDEAHALKEYSSNRTSNIFKYFNHCQYKLLMTGTPTPKKPQDIFYLLKFLFPEEFSNRKEFNEKYLGLFYDPEYKYNDGYREYPQYKNLKKLYDDLQFCSYRISKKEALPFLPDKIIQNIFVDLTKTEREEYNRIIDTFEGEPITLHYLLDKFLSRIKFQKVQELIEPYKGEDEKFVIADTHIPCINEFFNQNKDNAVLHTGGHTASQRDLDIERFKNDPTINFLYGNITTINVGLNLWFCNKMYVISLPRIPGTYDQLGDRLHRNGQKNAVTIFNVFCRDTIDEKKFETLQLRKKDTSVVNDGVEISYDVDDKMIGDIMNEIINERRQISK